MDRVHNEALAAGSARLQRASLVGVACLIFVIAGIGGDRFFPALSPDFVASYHPGALSLQRGDGYLHSNGELITHRPPGYSVMIAPLVVEDVRATVARVRWLLAALAALNVFLLAGILARVVPAAPRWLVLPLLVLWPPLLPLVNPGGSEMAFAVLLNAALLVLLHSASRPAGLRSLLIAAAGGGLLLGAAALTRVIGIAAVGAVALALLLGWRGWSVPWRAATAAALVAVVALALLPWALVVRAHTGQLSISSAGPASIRDGLERFPQLDAGRELADPETWRDGDRPATILSGVALRHPLSSSGLLALKLLRPWYATDSGRHDAKLMLLNAPWLILTLLAGIRTLAVWGRVPPGVLLLLGVVAACWLSAFVVLSIFRYLAPVFPAAVIAVAWHAHDLWRQGRARSGMPAQGG